MGEVGQVVQAETEGWWGWTRKVVQEENDSIVCRRWTNGIVYTSSKENEGIRIQKGNWKTVVIETRNIQTRKTKRVRLNTGTIEGRRIQATNYSRRKGKVVEGTCCQPLRLLA